MLKYIELILKMKNGFDYAEFISACNNAGVNIIPASEFAQKVGMLMVGIIMFPELTPSEAYLKFIEKMNSEYQDSQQSDKKSCGGCGAKEKIK